MPLDPRKCPVNYKLQLWYNYKTLQTATFIKKGGRGGIRGTYPSNNIIDRERRIIFSLECLKQWRFFCSYYLAPTLTIFDAEVK